MDSSEFFRIITSLKSELWFKILASSVMAALAGLSSLMANRYIAVYNDAARPLVGEAKKGNIKFRFLAISNFGLSIGFVIGFIPQSAALTMIVIHTILLMSDILGTLLPRKKWALLIAPLLGIAWGYGLYWGLEGIQWIFDNATYPGFGLELGKIGDVYNALFVIFPAMVIGYQFGWYHGLWSAIVIFITYLMISIYGPKIKVSPLAIGLLVGVVIMILMAVIKNHLVKKRTKITVDESPALDEVNHVMSDFFKQNALAIKTNKFWFLGSGTLVAASVTLFALQMPQTISFWATGDMTTVGITEVIRTFSFIPLVAVTALATGVYSPCGLTFSNLSGVVGAIIGLTIAKTTGHINYYLFGTLIGAVLGGLVQFSEVFALSAIAKWLDTNQFMRSMGDGIRTSISSVLTTSLLVGGVVASFIMGTTISGLTSIAGLSGFGMLLVLGVYLLNRTFKKPIPEIAIGPVMTIVFGIIINIIYFVVI